jgi:hypothetical protein
MDYSEITKQLYIGTTPKRPDYEVLRGLGIRLVINMRFLRGGRPPAGNPPIQYLRFRTIDSPLFPIPMQALLQGAQAAIAALRGGGKVYVHCSRGRHRSIRERSNEPDQTPAGGGRPGCLPHPAAHPGICPRLGGSPVSTPWQTAATRGEMREACLQDRTPRNRYPRSSPRALLGTSSKLGLGSAHFGNRDPRTALRVPSFLK